MESFPNVEESTIVSDTPEQIDTWNQPRSSRALREFVVSKMVSHGEFEDDDIFGLAA